MLSFVSGLDKELERRNKAKPFKKKQAAKVKRDEIKAVARGTCRYLLHMEGRFALPPLHHQNETPPKKYNMLFLFGAVAVLAAKVLVGCAVCTLYSCFLALKHDRRFIFGVDI